MKIMIDDKIVEQNFRCLYNIKILMVDRESMDVEDLFGILNKIIIVLMMIVLGDFIYINIMTKFELLKINIYNFIKLIFQILVY